MIDLYAWGTTNGRRGLIMAEESGLPFTLHQIDIRKGDQKTAAYEKINPYRKIPALVDSEGPGGKPAIVFEFGCDLLLPGRKGRQISGHA